MKHEDENGRLRGRGEADASAGGGRLRNVLLAAATLALGYLVWRRLRSGSPASDRDEASAGLGPDEGHQVPIDGPTDEGRPSARPDETASAVDPSLEEVDERVEDDVKEAHTAPGEMTVEEDVAEEAGEGVSGDESDRDIAAESTDDAEDEGHDESEE